jgi:hypothetical protein
VKKSNDYRIIYDSGSPSSKGCILSDDDDEIREFNTPIEKTFKEDYFKGRSKNKESNRKPSFNFTNKGSERPKFSLNLA